MLFGIPKIKHWTLFGLQRNMTKKNKVIVNKKKLFLMYYIFMTIYLIK